MNQFNLARLDYSLPPEFELVGRQQSASRVQINTFPLSGKTMEQAWREHIDLIHKDQIVKNLPTDTITVDEISPGFSIVFYFANSTLPHRVTAEAYQLIDQEILHLKFTGTTGKEDNIKHLFTIYSNDFRRNITNGFNVGFGSIIGEPSANEVSSARLKSKQLQCELTVFTHTAGPDLNKGPMDDIKEEIKGLAADGIKLDVLQQQDRTAAGLQGEEAIVSVQDPESNSLMLRYTWFYPGESGNSFKPEMLIKMSCPKFEQKRATEIWNGLIDSLKIRDL